ncbi:MAG: L,D-transpeptidase [Chloroflexi bacterium]|nr:L,D-transpeptidase [Chloroflexota bacterium]
MRVIASSLLALAFALVLPGVAAAHGDLWHGTVAIDEINVRAAPWSTAALVGTIARGETVHVVEWVAGEVVIGVNGTWGKLGPGRYIYTARLATERPEEPPPPPDDAPTDERWIDVNLTHQVVTAYDGRVPIGWALTSSGMPGWETPIGRFEIIWRIYNEWMSNVTYGGDDAYTMTGVLHTQYFTEGGNALHYNYWKNDSPFGVPTSHGCLGLQLADSRFFWEFAKVGMTVVIHR